MPELTIASAVSRTICSFTLQANLFQLFQPIGGVSARPFGALLTTSCVVSANTGCGTKVLAQDRAARAFTYARHSPSRTPVRLLR